MKIKLPILFHNDKTSALKDVDCDYSLSDCEIRNCYFYNINGIMPYIDDDKIYTSILANGDEFICTLPIEKVEHIIDQAKQQELILL